MIISEILQFMEKIMKKKTNIWLPVLLLAVLLSGCQKNTPSPLENEKTPDSDTVNLNCLGWCGGRRTAPPDFDGFQKKYQGQANFNITYQLQSESTCTDALMQDLENGADVFAFADDQLNTLVAAGALDQ